MFVSGIMFKDGCELEDDPCSGQPSTSWNEDSVRQVQEVVHTDHCQTVETIAENIGILLASCHAIGSMVLKMHCICQCIVLAQEQCYNDNQW
jgi:hypothetical protein